jgi:hypothetical protein
MAVVCRDLMFAQYKHLSESKGTNVPQTFHKCSNNLSERNQTFEFVPEFVLSIEIVSVWFRRADPGPNRKNLFPIKQIRETYQNVLVSSFQNDIGTFVLLFLTLLQISADIV